MTAKTTRGRQGAKARMGSKVTRGRQVRSAEKVQRGRQEKALEKVHKLIVEKWHKNNRAIKKLVELDEKTFILGRPARFILQEYLDRYGTLAKDSRNPKALKELATLLDSLEYLLKILKKLSKKKRFNI